MYLDHWTPLSFCYNPSTLYIPHRFAATVTLDQLDLPLFSKDNQEPLLTIGGVHMPFLLYLDSDLVPLRWLSSSVYLPLWKMNKHFKNYKIISNI